MKKVRRQLWAVLFCSFLFFLSCVTINIYFPAEEVKSVAGEIVNEIRGQEDQEKSDKEGNSLIRRIMFALAPSAAYAEDVTTVSNPTIRALKAKMKARFSQMKPFYQKGVLKEGADGYVSVGDAGGLGLKEKRDVKAMVDAENNDRRTLYAEVAKALKIDASQINKVADIFAKEWQKSF